MVDDGSDGAWLGGVDVAVEVLSHVPQEGSDERGVPEGCATRDDAVGAADCIPHRASPFFAGF